MIKFLKEYYIHFHAKILKCIFYEFLCPQDNLTILMITYTNKVEDS